MCLLDRRHVRIRVPALARPCIALPHAQGYGKAPPGHRAAVPDAARRLWQEPHGSAVPHFRLEPVFGFELFEEFQ
ncbi:MAG: hypothetical protein KDH48_16385, partial [Rhodoferax sp.]|nr:hypothetical protein [Rhodoferax sp.]